MQSSSLTICGINSGLSSKQTNHLPSWVPDFATSAVDSITLLCRPILPSPYRACGDVPLVAAWPYDERPDLLVTLSCKIETHWCLSALPPVYRHSTQVIMEWTRMASIGPNYPTGEFTPDVFCRTCVVDAVGPFRQSPMPKIFHERLCRLFEGCFCQYLARESGTNNMAQEIVAKQCANEVLATLISDVRPAREPNEGHPNTESPSGAEAKSRRDSPRRRCSY